MKVRALSHYDGDKDTRFGDCILGFSGSKLMIYDCGHERHADEVKEFLKKNTGISDVSIVVSHDDSDHSDGVVKLMEHLNEGNWTVTLYTHLYLKDVDEIHKMLDDGRRKKIKRANIFLRYLRILRRLLLQQKSMGIPLKVRFRIQM